MRKKIIVIGSGGWGTALAVLLADKFDVKIWSYESQTADEINNSHSNSMFLNGITIPNSIIASNDPIIAHDANIIVNVVPTQFISSTYTKYNFNIEGKPIVNGSKGIERNSLRRISEIFEDLGVNPGLFVALTGPSHAEEVARKSPTTVLAASDNIVLAKEIQDMFSTPHFRVYTSEDVVGAEIGGALKNVMAIAAGIIDGLGLGDNTKAALMTRGLAELTRLGISLGAKPHTFSGLSGLGDLVVTCASKHSRNRAVGEQIGRGEPVEHILSSMKMVAEGVVTAESAFNLGRKHNVELPISEKVYEILFQGSTAKEALNELMTREAKHEWWW